MIVKIMSSGKSFSGAADYLTHDPKAETDERVAWTHTLNLANDHVPSAVNEMLWTARDAELLKQEAGIRAGGRATENPVKHISLNWAPEDDPSREHMIETTQAFLRHMKWEEHQAILVAHDDKAYSHVHVLLNAVHPDTGLKLDESFEQRRAQAWALEYEREQGRIHCEQRLKDPEQREAAMPRNAWVEFQKNEKEFERAENSLQQAPISDDEIKNQKNAEWKILKDLQRDARTQFFADGKSEFSELRQSIYREVREEFRERWADFYAAKRDGADPESLATTKADLVADQKAVLEERRDAACTELRESRDQRYRELLDDQRGLRADLRARQEAGLDNTLFLQEAQARFEGRGLAACYVDAAGEVTAADHRGTSQRDEAPAAARSEGDRPNTNSGAHRDAGLRLGFRAGSLLDALFFDLTTLGSAPPSREPPRDPSGRTLWEAAADETSKHQQQQREKEQAEEEARQKQRSPGD